MKIQNLIVVVIFSLSLTACIAPSKIKTNTGRLPVTKALPEIHGVTCSSIVTQAANRLPQPRLTRAMMNYRQEGWVLSLVDYDPAGIPGFVKVMDASPEGVFDEVITNVLMKWRFPESEDGGSCGQVIEIEFQ